MKINWNHFVFSALILARSVLASEPFQWPAILAAAGASAKPHLGQLWSPSRQALLKESCPFFSARFQGFRSVSRLDRPELDGAPEIKKELLGIDPSQPDLRSGFERGVPVSTLSGFFERDTPISMNLFYSFERKASWMLEGLDPSCSENATSELDAGMFYLVRIQFEFLDPEAKTRLLRGASLDQLSISELFERLEGWRDESLSLDETQVSVAFRPIFMLAQGILPMDLECSIRDLESCRAQIRTLEELMGNPDVMETAEPDLKWAETHATAYRAARMAVPNDDRVARLGSWFKRATRAEAVFSAIRKRTAQFEESPRVDLDDVAGQLAQVTTEIEMKGKTCLEAPGVCQDQFDSRKIESLEAQIKSLEKSLRGTAGIHCDDHSGLNGAKAQAITDYALRCGDITQKHWMFYQASGRFPLYTDHDSGEFWRDSPCRSDHHIIRDCSLED